MIQNFFLAFLRFRNKIKLEREGHTRRTGLVVINVTNYARDVCCGMPSNFEWRREESLKVKFVNQA